MNPLSTALVVMLAASMAAVGTAPPKKKAESAAERLHRKGVFCMDEIERPDCAADMFEQLLELRTTERELVTDAMLRLVRLYQLRNEAHLAKPMLRQFWSAGIKARQTGHVPYSARYLPDTMDILFMIDVADLLAAPISKQVGADGQRWITTCDPGERQLLWERRRWKRAERKANEEGKQTIDVIYEEMDDAAEMRAKARERQRERTQEQEREPETYDPVFGDALCPVAIALGQDNTGEWSRMTGAMAHDDFRQSVGIIEVPGVAPKLEAGVSEGRLIPRGDRLWALPDIRYHGHEIHLANLDTDELVVGPDHLVAVMAKSRRTQRRTMSRSLDKLLGEIPRDVEFFFVMTEQAVLELGLGSLGTGQRGVFSALMPRPKGFQMSAVAHDYFGVFMRMPSDNAVKGSLLISLAQRLITSDETMDKDQKELMQNLDLSQSADKRALLMSYVLTPDQVRRIFFY